MDNLQVYIRNVRAVIRIAQMIRSMRKYIWIH